MRLFYIAVAVFCGIWSVYYFYAAMVGSSVANKGVVLRRRTVAVLALLVGWIGFGSAAHALGWLGPAIPVSSVALVLIGLAVAFVISLALDARQP